MACCDIMVLGLYSIILKGEFILLGASHAIMSFAVVYGTTGSTLAASVATVGAVFPDRIERVIYGKKWLGHHRQESHWFFPYLVLWWACQHYLISNPFTGIVTHIGGNSYIPIGVKSIAVLVAFFFHWFCAGCLLHIIEDAFFGPVPLLLPHKKKKLFFQFFKTGGIAEKILARSALAIAVLFRYIDAAAGVAR